VDDNNKLVEDNQGDPDPPPTGMTWLKPSFCPRRSQCHLKMKEKWIHTPRHIVAEMDELELFLMCFPVKYMKIIAIPQ
jgi:hypothetical protein